MSLPKDGGDVGAPAALSGTPAASSGAGGGSETGLPKEGSRVIGEGRIKSVVMDWCKSPTAIVPYRIWAYQREGMALANSVRQTDDRSHVAGSIVRHCYGDEAGVGGGILSGTHNAECTPLTWSSSVRAEGRNMVRHTDLWWMNHKNTIGKLDYTKDTNDYGIAEVELIKSRIPPLGNGDGPRTQVASAAGAIGAPAAGAGGGVGETLGQVGRGIVSGGKWVAGGVEDLGLGAAAGTAALASGFLLLMTTSTAKDDVIRVSGDCKLIPKKNNKCSAGSQAHHVVADRSMNPSNGRLLSNDDGLSLCLKGNAFPRSLLTGHAVAQSGYDLGARAAAATNSDGQLSLGSAENIWRSSCSGRSQS